MIDYSIYMTADKSAPRLEIYTGRIRHNARTIIELCDRAGVKVACVTKALSGHFAVARALADAGAAMLADSRLENIKKLRQAGLSGPFMLLRLPAVSQADKVVELADISLNSSYKTMKALGKVADARNKIHRVIIMVDVGDLREGVWPDKTVELVKKAVKIAGIEVIGLGCNLACYGGVIPSEQNMKTLVDTVNACRQATGLKIPIVCGGNSSGLPLLASGKLNKEVNLYRIGEAIILGRNVIDRSPWPDTRQDTVIAVAEVIEAEVKPSVPIGERGQDAFGQTQEFKDYGLRRRAICNIGRQDVAIDGIEPVDDRIKVLGGSSDHLILDVEDCKRQIEVGDEIAFYPNYGALLALSTSEYVEKVVIQDE